MSEETNNRPGILMFLASTKEWRGVVATEMLGRSRGYVCRTLAGGPGRIRTHDSRIQSPSLRPTRQGRGGQIAARHLG
jgi:hypothetical protein